MKHNYSQNVIALLLVVSLIPPPLALPQYCFSVWPWNLLLGLLEIVLNIY